MKIDSISLYHVAMPLVYPFRTAYADEYVIESVLVRMEGEGQVGWGETTPGRSPTYSPEWAGGVFATLRDWLAPRLIGQQVESGEALQRLLSVIKGNYFAKAGLDLAWWDLRARQLGQPLWKLIGGRSPIIQVGADFGAMETIDALLVAIGQAQEAGFTRVKLKYRPGWELEMIAAVRRSFPDLAIHIDCNSVYTLDALPMFRELDAYHLAMIEQPLAHDDLLDHAALQAAIQTPICLDESITSVARARKAAAVKACRWVNIKGQRVGGLTNALAIHDYCRGVGIPCWIGGMLESAVGQGFNIALSTLDNIHYPCDVFPSSRYYVEDLGAPDVVLSGPGQITASDAPGIGCAPHPDRLARMTLQQATIS